MLIAIPGSWKYSSSLLKRKWSSDASDPEVEMSSETSPITVDWRQKLDPSVHVSISAIVYKAEFTSALKIVVHALH